MKKTTIIAVSALAGVCLFLSNCAPEPEKTNSEGDTTQSEFIYKDTVSLTTAIANITNYVNNCKTYLNDSVPIRSYTLNRSDVFGVLGVTSIPNMKYDRCRVYIGMDSFNKFKLYMTPTVLNIKKTPSGSIDSTYVDYLLYDSLNKRYFVYDLNAPCPSTCDKNSKLYIRI